MSSPGRPDIDAVIVGAGISGLVTAFELQRRGLAVEVFDAGLRAGGVIGTIRREGALYETGPNSALDTTPQIDALLDALGIRGQRIDAAAVAATRYIVRDGKLLAIPTSPAAFLGTSTFTLGAKFRLWREPFVPPASPDVEESVASFVRRRLGTEFLDYAVDPFVAGVYAGDPERISVSAAFPRLHALEQRYGSLIKGQFQGARERRRAAGTAANTAHSFSFRDGMQTLTNALAEAVARIAAGVIITRVERDGDGTWTIAGTRDGEPTVRRARSVVLAVPAYVAASLVRDVAPPAAEGLAAIPYAPIAIVASAYRRDDISHPLDGFGFLVPRRERRKILGCLFSSSMFEGRAPEGGVWLTTFVGGAREPALASTNDAGLTAIVASELRELVGAHAEPTWNAITRWTHAIPQYNLGHAGRLHPVEEAERALPGLSFCANYRGGVSVGDRIKTSHAMADVVARFLGAAA